MNPRLFQIIAEIHMEKRGKEHKLDNMKIIPLQDVSTTYNRIWSQGKYIQLSV